MSERYNLCVPKPGGNNKTFWQKIGSMWVDGDKIKVKLDVVPVGMIQGKDGPVPWEGWVNAFPADKDNKPTGRSSGGGSKFDDDDIPY